MTRRTLATLFPPPRPVTLAGRVYLIPELTLGEIAEVEGVVESRQPDPIAGVRDLLYAASVPLTERRRIDRAFALAEGEPDPDAPEDDAHGRLAALGDEACMLVRVALRRHHSRVVDDGEMMDFLYSRITPDEYHSLHEAAYRLDAMTLLCRMMDRLCGTGLAQDGGDGTDWFDLVDRVSRSHGIGYGAIREMTLTQFVNALAEGRPREGRVGSSVSEAVATHRKWRRWLDGKDD